MNELEQTLLWIFYLSGFVVFLISFYRYGPNENVFDFLMGWTISFAWPVFLPVAIGLSIPLGIHKLLLKLRR